LYRVTNTKRAFAPLKFYLWLLDSEKHSIPFDPQVKRHFEECSVKKYHISLNNTNERSRKSKAAMIDSGKFAKRRRMEKKRDWGVVLLN